MDKKILIVDDDFDTLHMVGKMLERHGFQIIAANNGEKALRLAQSEHPDLIILDVMMPGMDGYDVTKQLRSTETTAFIPIILFTAKAQVDDKLEGFEAGADDYLTKPTHPAELIARVKSILARPKTGTLSPNAKTGQADEGEQGNLIAVIGTKGGVGATTVAINLAISIHQKTKNYITLAEMRPGQGSIGLQLGYRNSTVQNEMLKASIPEITLQRIEESLVTHGSGIQILLSSFTPSDAILQNNLEQMEILIKGLKKLAPNTVIDLGAGLAPITQRTINSLDQIVVVAEPVPSSLIQTKALLQNLDSLGVAEQRIFVLLVNRSRLEITVPNARVQNELNTELAGVIMPAPEISYQATLRHEALITHQPDSIPGRQYLKFADTLLQTQEVKG
ncbi:response regulator [bacterium]|nr:response regulator [bacterium]